MVPEAEQNLSQAEGNLSTEFLPQKLGKFGKSRNFSLQKVYTVYTIEVAIALSNHPNSPFNKQEDVIMFTVTELLNQKKQIVN